MSTSMSSGAIITREPGRCQKKRFLNLSKATRLGEAAEPQLNHLEAGMIEVESYCRKRGVRLWWDRAECAAGN